MHLRILGTGVVGTRHLTREALDHVNASNFVALFFAPEGWLHEIAESGKAHESLDHLYRDGGIDVENYKRIEEHVMVRLREYRDVCFCIPGHPRLGVSLTPIFEKAVRAEGGRVSVCVGISSWDTMLNDLCLDPLSHGTTIVDANVAILLDYQLDPAMDHFLYHVCSVGTSRTNYSNAAADNAIGALKEKLLKHFPAEHMVRLVSSRREAESQTHFDDVRLDELESLLPRITFASTLFVPAMKPESSRLNRKFLESFRQAP